MKTAPMHLRESATSNVAFQCDKDQSSIANLRHIPLLSKLFRAFFEKVMNFYEKVLSSIHSVIYNLSKKGSWQWKTAYRIILSSKGNTKHIEYLMLDENSPIKVAQYYTKLPDKKLLAEKLKRAVAIAKERLSEKSR